MRIMKARCVLCVVLVVALLLDVSGIANAQDGVFGIDVSKVENLQPFEAFVRMEPHKDIEESVVRGDGYCAVSFRSSSGNVENWRLLLTKRVLPSGKEGYLCAFSPLLGGVPAIRFLGFSMDAYSIAEDQRVRIDDVEFWSSTELLHEGKEYHVDRSIGEVSSLPGWSGNLARVHMWFHLETRPRSVARDSPASLETNSGIA
eukprot:ANDGO_03350.mRNA.1 hypothetical protein